LADALEVAQSANTLVYTVRHIGSMARSNPILRRRGSKSTRRLAEETGATAFSAPKDPGPVFMEIEDDLRNLYVLGFTLPKEARDGRFHGLEVKFLKLDGTVRGRRGYTTPAL
jgi:hypothetical protein